MSKSKLAFPVQDFRHIVQACRADEPLESGDERFADLTALRAGSSVVNELSGSLEQELEDGQFHRCIVAGHRGSGKSTELL